MGDLISRKALIEDVEKGLKGTHHDNNLVEKAHRIEHIHLLNVIASQPTAFDAEKVIEKLEFAQFKCQKIIDGEGALTDLSRACINRKYGIQQAIEIVNGGGIDDE